MIYNYRHSTARRVIENAFGILIARWSIFSHPIKASVQNTEKYVIACLCLHNYLRQTENSLYTPQGFVDVELADGKIKEKHFVNSKIRSVPWQINYVKSVGETRGDN